MDVQQIIDAATAAQATTLGQGEAAQIFRSAFNGSIKCRVNLKDSERNYLRRTTTFTVVFTKEITVTHDHALMCAMRDIVRTVFSQNVDVLHSTEKTLIVGAASREIRHYQSNPNVHYWVYGKENKDFDRTIRSAYHDIAKQLKVKASKAEKRVYLDGKKNDLPPVIKRYRDVEQIYKDYVTVHKMPDVIHTDPVECVTLIFEDSIYNYDERMLVDLFEETNAQIAYGYALLPLELAFPEMAPNKMYTVRTHGSGVTKTASLTFNGGYSNGYNHSYGSWTTLLRAPAFTFRGVTLAIEITSRVGPMACFKIYRAPYTENIVRTLSLPENEEYVRVLDVYASIDHKSLKWNRPFKYFSVREEIYTDVILYALALDSKSVTLVNILTYIRRRVGGMSLVSKELVAPWDIPREHLYPLAVACTMQAMIMQAKMTETILESTAQSVYKKLKALLLRGVRLTFYPITLLYDWIVAEMLTDKIILFPSHRGEIFQAKVLQQKRCEVTGELINPSFNLPLTTVFPPEKERPPCPICLELDGKLGAQIVDCQHVMATNHKFELNQTQLNELLARLRDDDNDAPGLKAVKQAAKEACPTTPFSYECPVYIFRAGPGCGKSHILRKLADPDKDMVLAPFTKLMVDYMQVKGEDGKPVDYYFKTQHRGMTASGSEHIHLDEFTAFDYAMLCAIVEKNHPRAVFLYGDPKQTKIIEPQEGLYIGNYIDLDSKSNHTLRMNFRNPPAVVGLLNKVYGYNMIPFSKEKYGIEVIQPPKFANKEYNPDLVVPMGFTHHSAQMYAGDAKCTVRANQGSTHDNVRLTVTQDDGTLPMLDPLAIVALSRHRHRCIILTDMSEQAQAFLRKNLLYPKNEDDPLSLPIYDEWQQYIPPIPSKADIVIDNPPEINEILDHYEFTEDGTVVKDEDDDLDLRPKYSDEKKKVYGPGESLDPNEDALDQLRRKLKELDAPITPPIPKRVFNKALDMIDDAKPAISTCLTISELSCEFGCASLGQCFHKTADCLDLTVNKASEVVSHTKSKLGGLRNYLCCFKPDVQMEAMLSDSDEIVGDGIIRSKVVCAGVDYDPFDFNRMKSIPHKLRPGILTRVPAVKPVINDNYLVNGPNKPLQPFIDREAPQEFMDHIQTHQGFYNNDTRPYELYVKDDKPFVEQPMEHPSSNAHLLHKILVPAIACETDITSINFAGSQAVRDTFRSAMSNPQLLVGATVNKRHHPINLVNKYRTAGPGYGSNFTGKVPLQELSVIAQRYDNPKPKYPFNDKAKLLAEKMVDEYYDEYKTAKLFGENWSNIGEDVLDRIATEFCKQAAAKNYDKTFNGFDYTDGRLVRLHLKSIFKPDTTAKLFDVMKAGQGISAWSPDALSLFCFMFRVMQTVDILTNRNDEMVKVFNEHGKSEYQFISEVTDAIRRMNHLPIKQGSTDGYMFDSMQNEFTQYVEYYYWARAGFNKTSLDHYYSFRHHYKIYGGISTSKGEWEKTSGEPGTLANNEVVDKVSSNYVLKGVGPQIVTNKGDDYLKIQMELEVNKQRQDELDSYCPLRLRTTIKEEGEFCGYTISKFGFSPNLMRRVTKITGCRWRNYQHFCEYQKSLRDYIKLVQQTGVNNAIAGTMQNSKCTEMEATMALYFIDSFSHLNEEQWLAATYEAVEQPWMPVQDDVAPLAMVFKY